MHGIGGNEKLSVVESFRRNQARALRDPVAARRGRDGRGLPRQRLAAFARGRGQGAAVPRLADAGGAPEVRAGGADRVAALPPPRLRALRRGPRRRHRVPRHGAARRRDAGPPAGEGSAADRPGDAFRRRDRVGAPGGPPQGDRAPGSQARQRHAHEDGRQAARLRAREGVRDADPGRRAHAGADGDGRQGPHGRGFDRRHGSRTWRPSSSGERRPTRGRTCLRSARCSTKCRPGAGRFPATTRRRSSRRS